MANGAENGGIASGGSQSGGSAHGADFLAGLTESSDGGFPDVGFTGEHQHTLDAKGRVILPSEFRDGLSNGGFLTKLPEGCVGLFPDQEFRRVVAKLRRRVQEGIDDNAVLRTIGAASKGVMADGQGRIPVPDTLRAWASLERDITIVGSFNHIELWNSTNWQVVNAAPSEIVKAGHTALAAAMA